MNYYGSIVSKFFIWIFLIENGLIYLILWVLFEILGSLIVVCFGIHTFRVQSSIIVNDFGQVVVPWMETGL